MMIRAYNYFNTRDLGMIIFPKSENHEDFWRRTHILEKRNSRSEGAPLLSLGFIDEIWEQNSIDGRVLPLNPGYFHYHVMTNNLEERSRDQAILEKRLEDKKIEDLLIEDDRKTRDFQMQSSLWAHETFDPDIISNVAERCHRFLEEALELVQSIGYSKERAHQMVDYVFGRDAGEVTQEIGGVMVSLYVLGVGLEYDIDSSARVELARCFNNIEKIRAKQSEKPKTLCEM